MTFGSSKTCEAPRVMMCVHAEYTTQYQCGSDMVRHGVRSVRARAHTLTFGTPVGAYSPGYQAGVHARTAPPSRKNKKTSNYLAY